MMRYELRTIPLDAISVEDRTFIITTDGHSERLQKSIEQVGLLCPPYIYFDDHTQYYKIVCGLRRINACAAAGWKEIAACIVDQACDEKELFLISFYDNLSHRVLNPVEQARTALRLLVYFTADTVISEYLPLLGLAPTEKTLTQLLCIARLDPDIQAAVSQERICESIAAKLALLPEEDRKALFGLFSRVHLSASKQEEIVSYCMDISLRDGTACSEIVRDREIQDIIDADKQTLSQRGDRVRALLRRRRFPVLSGYEEKFLQQRKKLRLPGGVQLLSPPFFEGGRFRIEIEFSRTADLREKAKAVMNMADSGPLQDIVDKP
jgi:ParB family transcriptional regulator, chromosome partitioning protein